MGDVMNIGRRPTRSRPKDNRTREAKTTIALPVIWGTGGRVKIKGDFHATDDKAQEEDREDDERSELNPS
jgi:hypothetical protein